MLQATVCDGLALDALTLSQDHLVSAEVDVGRRGVIDALVVANVTIVFDEGSDLPLEIARQIVIVE
jgi:hypothetical protein